MRTLEWKNNLVKMIDQTLLPLRLKFVWIKTADQMVKAIKSMQVRGAPAIGVAAAFGCVLGVDNLKKTALKLIASRPTAVNLKWAVDRILRVAKENNGVSKLKLRQILLAEAQEMAEEDIATNRRMGKYGSALIKKGMSVLTVCNAGALATVDYGTALGVIRSAHETGKQIQVFAAETRPRLQGAKLTSWELKQMGVPFTLITDNMIGYFMCQGKIDFVVVGADRIARNGDTANKIGTYAAAILAKTHAIPFYIAAPVSTIDFSIATGEEIIIEERDPSEVTNIGCERIAPEGIRVANPAFDVTPAKYISGIITEKGVFKPKDLKLLTH